MIPADAIFPNYVYESYMIEVMMKIPSATSSHKIKAPLFDVLG